MVLEQAKLAKRRAIVAGMEDQPTDERGPTCADDECEGCDSDADIDIEREEIEWEWRLYADELAGESDV